jgi:hypothetical protein
MVWTESGWHGSWWYVILEAPAAANSLADPLRVTLWPNTITPNPANGYYARYGVAPYVADLASPPGWPAGGVPVPGGLTVTASPGRITVDGPDISSAGPVTLTPYGSMIYSAVAGAAPNLAFCYSYFGGAVPAVDGPFSIIWAPEGVAVMLAPLTARTP